MSTGAWYAGKRDTTPRRPYRGFIIQRNPAPSAVDAPWHAWHSEHGQRFRADTLEGLKALIRDWHNLDNLTRV